MLLLLASKLAQVLMAMAALAAAVTQSLGSEARLVALLPGVAATTTGTAKAVVDPRAVRHLGLAIAIGVAAVTITGMEVTLTMVVATTATAEAHRRQPLAPLLLGTSLLLELLHRLLRLTLPPTLATGAMVPLREWVVLRPACLRRLPVPLPVLLFH